MDGVFDKEKFKSGNYILVVPLLYGEDSYYYPGDRVELQFIEPDSEPEAVKDASGNIVDYIYTKGIKKSYEVMAVVDLPYSMTTRRFTPNALVTILPEEEMYRQEPK